MDMLVRRLNGNISHFVHGIANIQLINTRQVVYSPALGRWCSVASSLHNSSASVSRLASELKQARKEMLLVSDQRIFCRYSIEISTSVFKIKFYTFINLRYSLCNEGCTTH